MTLLPPTHAWRALVRRPRRLILFVAGVTVASAVLLDMVMLAAGLQKSLSEMLEATGYEVRLVPKGLLPFEGGAAVLGSDSLIAELSADPRVAEAIPLWGQTVYVTPPEGHGEPLAAFGYGAPVGKAPAIRLDVGRSPRRPAELVIDRRLAERFAVEPGDSLLVGLEPNPAVGALRSRKLARISGVADFMFAAESSYTLALPITDMWEMAAIQVRPASLILVKVAGDTDAFAVARDYRERFTGVDVYAIPEIIEKAGDRLSYFQQLSLVLGSVSLIVAFLLVATLLTLSVNERWSEIATLRAIGVTRGRTLVQVAWQGLVITAAGTAVGFAVGLLVSRYLDRILTSLPGLPADVSFFVLDGRDAFESGGLLLVTGLLAGLYPAWRAASVNIAQVLREEIE